MSALRTNILIDKRLMRQVLRATGLSTMREAVDVALRFLLKLKGQERIRRARGKLRWEGNLGRMRRDR